MLWPKRNAATEYSSGETNLGRPNDLAVRAASEAGVPVWTIALGTKEGTVLVEGSSVAVPVNGPALSDIAASTGGTFYEARSAKELTKAFSEIRSSIGPRSVREGVTPEGLGLAFLVAVAAASLVWSALRRSQRSGYKDRDVGGDAVTEGAEGQVSPASLHPSTLAGHAEAVRRLRKPNM